MNPRFHQRLQEHRSRLRRRGLAFLLSVWLLGLAALYLACAGFEWFLPWQETTALSVTILFGIGALIGFPVVFERFRRRNPVTTRSIAQHIEQAHPELMDSLNCSIDILEGHRSRESWFAPELVRRTDERLGHIAFEQEEQPGWARPARIAVLCIAALAALVLANTTRLADKAWWGFLATAGVADNGIVITPEDLAVPMHSNLEIAIDVTRWEKEGEIVFETAGMLQRFPVVFEADGIGRFRFYDIAAPIHFRIETPALASDVLTIEPFIPPKIDAASIVVIPPIYSGLEAIELEALGNLEVLEGSEILFELEANLSGGRLETGETGTPLQGFGANRWQVNLRATEDTPYLFALTSPSGHQTRTRAYEIDVLPDEPPLIEIWNPGEDVAAEPGTTLPLEIYVADDFGLTELLLFVSVSGDDRRIVRVPLPESEEGQSLTEAEIQSALDLNSLGAVDGDAVSYYAVVSDNREPAANSTRSDIFFIEVRVEKPPIEMEGGMPLEQEGLELRAFVVELKRLIRETYAASESTGEVRERKNQEIGADLGTLRNELAPVREMAAPLLLDTPLEPVIDWFDEAIIRLEQAELLVNQGQPEEAIRFEEQALSNLVRIDNALRMNIIARDSSGSGEGESEESQSSEQQMSQSESSSSPQNPIDAINQMRAELERLIARQNRLNAEMERQQRNGASSEAMENVAREQAELREETRELGESLSRLPDATGARSELRDARRNMRDASDALEAGNAREAHPSGMRAREGLLAAAAELEEMAANAASRAVSALGQAAGSLADKQAELSGETGSAERGERSGEGLYEEQNELGDGFDQLMEQLAAGEQMLESLSPEMAERMGQIREGAAGSGTGRDMSRAANALLYERYGRAQQSQRSAESALRDLQSQLSELESMRPPPGAEALERAIAGLERDQERLQGEPADDGSELATPLSEKWSERLENLSQGLDDPNLSQIAGSMNRLGMSGASGTSDLSAMMQSAREELTRHWIRALRERELDINRESAPPPPEYRSQVEAYFRSLAEEN